MTTWIALMQSSPSQLQVDMITTETHGKDWIGWLSSQIIEQGWHISVHVFLCFIVCFLCLANHNMLEKNKISFLWNREVQ